MSDGLRGDAFGEDRLALGSHLGDEVVGDIGRGLARARHAGARSARPRRRGARSAVARARSRTSRRRSSGLCGRRGPGGRRGSPGQSSPRARAPSRCRKAMSRPPRSCASKGPIAKPKPRMAASISAMATPRADEVLGGGAVALEDAVADEAVADAGLDRDLAQLRGEGETSGERLGAGFRGRDDLKQLHHVGWAEEVQADEASGVRQSLSDGAGVEIGGIGGEDRVRAAGAPSASKTARLTESSSKTASITRSVSARAA